MARLLNSTKPLDGSMIQTPEARAIALGPKLAGTGVSTPGLGSTGRARTALQAALDRIGCTAEWIAERMKENAQAYRPVTYMGQITKWVPDTPTRTKAIEQINRIKGEYQETETAGLALGLEISLDERRQLQVKAAARLGAWGREYDETGDEPGDDPYPTG